MSICHCMISQEEKENEEKGIGLGMIKKAFRYQLKDNDISHLMEMSDFFKKNPDLCVSDITNGKKIQIKVSEFDPHTVKRIRERSGYDH